MILRFLGTGTSTGVPEVGCRCEVCTSADRRDRRLRTSALVHTDEGAVLLLDCGPDFREQMLQAGVFEPIDTVLLTHEHYDHVGGLDDLRPFCRFADIPVRANAATASHLRTRMAYCFVSDRYPGVPRITLYEVMPGIPFWVKGTEVMPLQVMHGQMPILGYRIGGRLAYITDMSCMPRETEVLLQGVEVLVVNALRVQPHATHQSISQALDVAARIGAAETYFVHMSHQAGLHAAISRHLPSHVHFAYDGLEISF